MLAQRTLKSLTRAVGVGVHSGQKVELTLRPAPADHGITFRRTDLPVPVDIPVNAFAVSDTRMASTISPGGDPGAPKVQTIEHLMSACAGLGLDNLYVDINADEVPEIASQLSQAFGVRSIPFCVMFMGGQPVDGFVGALPEAQIRAFLDKHLPSADELSAFKAELVKRAKVDPRVISLISALVSVRLAHHGAPRGALGFGECMLIAALISACHEARSASVSAC
jgi:hypothetical protein